MRVRAMLDQAGLLHRLHVEAFAPPAIAAPATPTASRAAGVRAQRRDRRQRGRHCSSRPRPPGSRPSRGCRMGICHTCTCRKVAGAARNVITGEVHDRARRATSSSASTSPVGDVELDPRLIGGAPMPTSAPQLTPEQLEAFGEELDADPRARSSPTSASATLTYIRRVIRPSAALEVTGRGTLLFGLLPPAWVGGTTALSLSKILDNMEIGHNVMHGQYDWTGDPALDGDDFEWDTTCPSAQWRHSPQLPAPHAHEHPRQGPDIGYGILRVSDEQPWRSPLPRQPRVRGAAGPVLRVGRGPARRRHRAASPPARCTLADKSLDMLKEIGARSGASSSRTTSCSRSCRARRPPPRSPANLTANLVRNLWTFTIIFCGHFPDGTLEFTEEEVVDESRGELVLPPDARLGQHHGWLGLPPPDRQPEPPDRAPSLPRPAGAPLRRDRPEVREICERYGLPYNTGGLGKQFGSVVRKIVQLAVPPAKPQTAATTGPDEPELTTPAAA